MKKDPSVNVIMPNYSKGQFIEEAINSVLNQKYNKLSLIKTIISVLMISISSLKRYGFK